MLVKARYAVLNFSRPIKRLFVLIADVLVCLISTWIAFALRLDDWLDFSGAQWKVFAIAATISLPIFIHYKIIR